MKNEIVPLAKSILVVFVGVILGNLFQEKFLVKKVESPSATPKV